MNGENRPFLLRPAAKDYLWGGTRLNDDFNIGINIEPFAEAWVCSCHPDGQSFVIGTGESRGESLVESLGENLGDLLKRHPEYLGTHAASVADGEFPILIKLIDAKKDLSVQVYPDDEYAKEHENCLGKAEMWYVLDARNGAELVYGFNRNVTAELVRGSIANGEISNLLNHVEVHKNDLFLIESKPPVERVVCTGPKRA